MAHERGDIPICPPSHCCEQGASNNECDFHGAAENDERQPREAAAADARIQAERNGCLPLAARSGWHCVSFSFAPDENQVLILKLRVKPTESGACEHHSFPNVVHVAGTAFRVNGLDHSIPLSNPHYVAFTDWVTGAVCRLTPHANNYSTNQFVVRRSLFQQSSFPVEVKL